MDPELVSKRQEKLEFKSNYVKINNSGAFFSDAVGCAGRFRGARRRREGFSKCSGRRWRLTPHSGWAHEVYSCEWAHAVLAVLACVPCCEYLRRRICESSISLFPTAIVFQGPEAALFKFRQIIVSMKHDLWADLLPLGHTSSVCGRVWRCKTLCHFLSSLYPFSPQLSKIKFRSEPSPTGSMLSYQRWVSTRDIQKFSVVLRTPGVDHRYTDHARGQLCMWREKGEEEKSVVEGVSLFKYSHLEQSSAHTDGQRQKHHLPHPLAKMNCGQSWHGRLCCGHPAEGFNMFQDTSNTTRHLHDWSC